MENVFLEEQDLEEKERALWVQEERIPILEAGREVGHVELEAHVDELLRRGRGYLREYAHNEALYQRRKAELLAELDDWRDRVQRPLEQRLRWLEGMLQPLFRMMRTGKKKSKALPNGTIGVRMRPAHVEVVDKEAAVLFCEANGIPLKKEPYKKPLKDFILANGGTVPKAAGIVFTPAQEDGTFYWKTPEHDLLKKKADGGDEE